jgi:hypothetical protein
MPSGVRRSPSSRGSDCTPRQGEVGSSFAYAQLLIQPIQSLRGGDAGRFEYDRLA